MDLKTWCFILCSFECHYAEPIVARIICLLSGLSEENMNKIHKFEDNNDKITTKTIITTTTTRKIAITTATTNIKYKKDKH